MHKGKTNGVMGSVGWKGLRKGAKGPWGVHGVGGWGEIDVWVHKRKMRDKQVIRSIHFRLLREGRFICRLSLENSLGICASLFSLATCSSFVQERNSNSCPCALLSQQPWNNIASSHPSSPLCLRLLQGADGDQHHGSLQIFLEEFAGQRAETLWSYHRLVWDLTCGWAA